VTGRNRRAPVIRDVRVQGAAARPAQAFFSVPYRDHWLGIADRSPWATGSRSA
jgi:hypothetical protein